MPRAGWIKPETDQRLPDHLAIAMLTRVYPPLLVDRVIAATDRLEERRRLLPARVVVYYVLAMALFNEASYEGVMRRLLEGLAWQERWASGWQLPTKAAIFKARARLGVEPIAELFRQTVRPLTTVDAPGAWYQGRPVVTVDCLEIELAGEGSGKTRTEGAVLRVVGFVEQCSHVALAIAVGEPGFDAAATAADELTGRWRNGPLYLTDHLTATPELRTVADRQGAAMLWSLEDTTALRVVEELPDGSRLVVMADATTESPERLRLLEGTDGTPLLTTMTDPAAAPGADLCRLYAGRATLTACLDDLRVHQGAPTMVPRSKSHDGALQEVYGLLLTHYAIQSLLAAEPTGDL